MALRNTNSILMKQLVALLIMVTVAVACSSNGSPTPAPAAVPSPSLPSPPESVAALVGRWERVNTCQDLVDGLEEAGLGELAPVMVAGNGFVPGSAKQLAKRADLCRGATPRVHAHFFTADGVFGSLDWNDQQVDDGTYEIVNDNSVTIGDGDTRFHFEIVNGDTLMLKPVIPEGVLAEALEHPDEFSGAGWSVAVAFPGHTWKRVACDGWC